MISMINPKTRNSLIFSGDYLIDSITREQVAIIINGIPRFLKNYQDYAQNFGYQWNKWNSILSDSRNPHTKDAKYRLLLERNHFDKFPTEGKTILECGCGGGDDTEILLKFGFGEIHSFDVSNAVDRAKKFINDHRAVFS